MGEVYRARDTRLDRDVAVKILPPAFTADADRVARFEREARLLASLNHANIATIHGVEGDHVIRALTLPPFETALELGINDRARHRDSRSRVCEPPNGARAGPARTQPRLPAVRPDISRQLIDAVTGGGRLLVYYPDAEY